jgi:hypothetical protein
MSDLYSLVRRAIVEKKRIYAIYNGHRREMCSHVIGTKDGSARALFFQFGGTSSRGLPPDGDWRCLPLDGLSDVSIHDGPWRTKAHTRPQSCIDDIDLEVT